MWDKHLPKWRTYASENTRTKGTKIDKEIESKLLEEIERFKNQARPADSSTDVDLESADNVVLERKVPVRMGKWRIIPPEVEKQKQNNK